MTTLHTITNSFDEGEMIYQFTQESRQPIGASLSLGKEYTLGDFLVEFIIDPLTGIRDHMRLELEELLDRGMIESLFAAAAGLHARNLPPGREARQTRYGVWKLDSVVIQEPTLREMQEDLWASDPDYPKAGWKEEVDRDETHLGYWEWVESNREQDERHFIIRNTDNRDLFWSNPKGYVDFASATRFSGGDRFRFSLPDKGEWMLENDVIPWKVGDRVTWNDPDDGICTHTGVVASIVPLGGGRLALVMTDGWEEDVMASDLEHTPE